MTLIVNENSSTETTMHRYEYLFYLTTILLKLISSLVSYQMKQRQQQKSSHQQQLEDILADPTANWSDIRSAIKAHGRAACTNTALIAALSRRMSSTDDMADNQEKIISVIPTNFISSGELSASEEDDSQDGDDLKPYASRPSINLMHFGVNPYNTLDASSRSGSACELRRRSSCSVTNYTCDSDGFMGWEHNDDDDDNKSIGTSCLDCDSEGFLPWQLTASIRASNAIAAEMLAKKISEANLGTSCDPEEDLDDSWRIEDYEERSTGAKVTEDSLIKSDHSLLSFYRRSSAGEQSENEVMNESSSSIVFTWKKYNPYSYHSKKLDSSLSPQGDLEEVKKALMNVRSNARTHRRKVSDASPQDLSQESTMTKGVETSKPTRRSSLIDLSALKTGITSAKKDFNCPFSKVDSSCDHREAIRISQEDGGVDISKEYRKLYSVSDEGSSRRFLASFGFSKRNLSDNNRV